MPADRTKRAFLLLKYNMSKDTTLHDLYHFDKNVDGSYTMTQEEFTRFVDNFNDYLEIRYAIKYNPYAKDIYDKLYFYSKWFNEI